MVALLINELERVLKEAVVVGFEVPSRHLASGTKENTKNLSKDSRSLREDRNLGLAE